MAIAKQFRIKFGPLIVGFMQADGDDKAFEILRDWFSAGLSDGEMAVPDVLFCVGLLDQQITFWDGRAWQVSVVRLPIGAWRVICSPKFSGRIKLARLVPAFFLRAISPDFADFHYLRASYFLYNIFVPVMQTAFVEKGVSFIHASSVYRKGGKAILISGRGGSGKTSASTYFYLAGGNAWIFLSDDFAILDREGNLYPNSMPLNIYPYNTEAFPELRKLVASRMPPLERMNWFVKDKVRGPKGVMKRMPYWKPLSQEAVVVGAAFHIVRNGVGRSGVEPMAVAEFSSGAKDILLYELANKQALFVASGMPSIDKIGASAAHIYEKALIDRPVFRVHIPDEWSQQEIGRFLFEVSSEYGK